MPHSDLTHRTFLAGGGSMGALMRAHDWTTTAFGDPACWPESLITLVRVLLSSQQPMFIAWGDTRSLLYNDSYAPMLGKRHPTALGRPFFDTWPEVLREVGGLMDRVFAGEPVHMDDLALTVERNGVPEVAHFAFSYTPVVTDDHSIVGLFCACNETTELVAAQQALHDGAARLKALNADLERQVTERSRERSLLWRLSPDIMLVAAFTGVLQAVNPAWEDMLGWAADELIGISLFDLIHPDDIARTIKGAEDISRGTALSQFENRYRQKNGGYRWISWTAGPGEGVIVAVGRDITADHENRVEKEKLEAQLRQSQKMEAVGQLTGGLAHDFNNLLAGISGSLELIRMRLSQGRIADVDKYVAAAQGATKRAAALTHRLLAFSRRQTLAPKPTDIKQLVSGMEELIARTVGPAITMETINSAGLWRTLID